MRGWRYVLTGGLSVLLVGCAATADDAQSAEPLHLGVVAAETGAARFGGLSRAQAVELAVEDINAAGGVLGRSVELSTGFSGADGQRLAEAVEQVVDRDDVTAAIGPDNSGETLETLEWFVAGETVLCGPNATADALSAVDDGGFYFRTAPPDRHQGAVLADVVAGLGVEPVTLFVQGGPYGEGLAEVVAAELDDRGVTQNQVVFDPMGKDQSATVRALLDADPAAVVALTHVGPALGGLAQSGLGPRDLPVVVSDGLAVDEVFQNIDPSDPTATEGMLAVRPGHDGDHPDPALLDRVAGGHFTAHAYDCAVLVALAAEAAGSVDSTAVRDRMIDVSRQGQPCRTFATCVELVRDGVDIDYDGLSGPIDLDSSGDPSTAIYHVLEFGPDGRMTVVEEVTIP